MLGRLATTLAALALLTGHAAQAAGGAKEGTNARAQHRQSGPIATVYRSAKTGEVTSLQPRDKNGRLGTSRVVLSVAESKLYREIKAAERAQAKQAAAKQRAEVRFLAVAAKTGVLSPQAVVLLVKAGHVGFESVMASRLSHVHKSAVLLSSFVRKSPDVPPVVIHVTDGVPPKDPLRRSGPVVVHTVSGLAPSQHLTFPNEDPRK